MYSELVIEQHVAQMKVAPIEMNPNGLSFSVEL
jgi:hypothetical protein